MKKLTHSKSRRIRKAYWTAFKIILSYTKLYLLSKIFGKKYYEKNIVATHLRNANRAKKAILKLQGLFIKIGQLLSILTNVLPEAFHEPLEGLQDKIPARPYSEIQKRIIVEFGKKPLEIFKTFEEVPIAAASIGQAHRATLPDGTAVVVKVQHANIEEIAQVDLEIMRRLTKLAEWFFEIKGIEHAYEQVRKMIEEELDYRQEAVSMQRVQENLKAEAGLTIPELHLDFCTQRVLTTTFYQGVKISEVQQLDDWHIDRRDLGDRLVHAYCQMVFEDGFYHADPHPGNILVQADGTMVLLDFGATAELREEMRTGFLKLIEAVVKNDTEKIILSLKELGFLADDRDAERVTEKMIDAFRYFLQNEVQFDGLSLKDIKVNPFDNSLFNLTSEIGFKSLFNTMQVPKDYVLLNRMVSLLLGICNTLDSQMNPLDTIRPYFQKFVMGEKGNLVDFITSFVQQNVATMLSLPIELQAALKKVNKGELEVNVAATRERNRIMYALGQQFFCLILAIVCFVFSYLFYKDGILDFSKYAAIVGGVFMLLMWRKR